MRGDSTTNSTGSFGTQGISSPTNEPPAVYEACEWTDHNGNLWLYGGQQGGGLYGDLWKYDTTANEWTWIKGNGALNQPGVYGTQGVSAPTNTPGGRDWAPTSWVDQNNDLWMFGGQSTLGDMNDLWRYNISTNEWTWMKGANTGNSPGSPGTMGVPALSNEPAARHENACSWVDNNGDLWFFGAYGSIQRDDLWRYNVTTNMWTWMKGDPNVAVASVYGTLGVPDSLNTPGARNSYSRWVDPTGNLWLFGGDIYGSGAYNDLWKFDISINQWAWMNGPNTPNSAGNYGTKCVELSSNLPHSRFENRNSWVDSCGNFWIFGGADAVGNYNTFNDLWKYSTSSGDWTWVSGSASLNAGGLYGTQSVSTAFTQPPSRMGSLSWFDNGNIWMFGGSTGASFMMRNDLWRYVPDPACAGCLQALPVAHFTSSDTAFCTETGKCISFFDHSTGNPTSWHWSFPGAIPDSSNLQNPDSICYYNTGTYPVTLIVSNTAGSDTLAVTPLIIYATAPPLPTINVIGGDTLVSSHASYYQWYRDGSIIAGATDSFYIATQGGTYAVQITDSLGCTGLSNGVLITTVSSLNVGQGLSLYPNPVSDELTVSFLSQQSNQREIEIIITNTVGEEMYRKMLQKSGMVYSISMNGFSNGVYQLHISDGTTIFNKKFVVMHK